MTDYNKTSCRACGNALRVTKTCSHCSEPVNWKCSSCPYVDDSIHDHVSDNQNVQMLGIVDA